MKKTHYYPGLFLLLLLISTSCRENKSPFLNLDFESIDLKTNKALGWDYYEKRYKASLDNEIVYSGKYSLKIESDSLNKSIYNGATVCIIFDSIPINQKIRLSGFIKNEGTNCDTLGLFINYNYPRYNLGNELISTNFTGSHDWQEYSIEIMPNGPVDHILLGVRMKGSGKIWIDNLRLFIDDKKIDRFPVQNSFKASKEEIEWLTKHSVPIKTVHSESGFKDLEPMKEYLKNARIVALGENTHGTHEIFEMKHRLLEFLSTEMGFNIFSIESAMFNTDQINEYLLTGKGDPKKLLFTLTNAWNTQEVLDMIIWMNKFNRKGERKLQFTGFDMQNFNGSLSHLSYFANHFDLYLKPLVDSLSFMFNNSPKSVTKLDIEKQNILKTRKCDQILSYLKNAQNQSQTKQTENELNVVIQTVKVIQQYLDYFSNGHPGEMRDRYMAENVLWILENNPNAKIVLWAHNEHISKQKGSMGEYLSSKYGDKYYSIGFSTNEGKYSAGVEKKFSVENLLVKGEPGSFEYNFSRTGLPCFFFDLRSINNNDPESLWLDKKLNQRVIGAEATDYQFTPTLLRKKFDGVIFINSTTASKTFVPTNINLIP